jgi:hypothetical protein
MANDTVSGDFTLYRADWDKEQLNIERRWIMELAKMCNFTVSDTPIDDLEIISEKIGDKFDVCVSQKTINKILSDGITTSIFDRLCREIKVKLATKMVGNCLDLCSPNAVAVKMEDANGELPQYRKVTKSKTDKRAAAFGLLLNPAQIEIM